MTHIHVGLFAASAALVASQAAREFAEDVIESIRVASSFKTEAINAGIDQSQLTRELATFRMPIGRVALFSVRVQQHFAVRRAMRVGIPEEFIVAPRLKRAALRIALPFVSSKEQTS